MCKYADVICTFAHPIFLNWIYANTILYNTVNPSILHWGSRGTNPAQCYNYFYVHRAYA